MYPVAIDNEFVLVPSRREGEGDAEPVFKRIPGAFEGGIVHVPFIEGSGDEDVLRSFFRDAWPPGETDG